MLNTKYIIYDSNSEPIENPCAFGNAWIVNNIHWVDTPNDEFEAIATTDVRHTAIINRAFEPQIKGFSPKSSAEGKISLTDYQPNQLTYSFNAVEDQLVVFSEIWTEKGWLMTIDGQEHPLFRANYVLRCALIPAGEHEIRMRYEPKLWRVGNTVDLIASSSIILSLIVLLIYSITKLKHSKQTP